MDVTARQIRLSAVTAHPRRAVVSALTTVLNELGWVVDFHQFSNSALAVHFEVAPERVSGLPAALGSLPLELSAESERALATLRAAGPADSTEPIPGSILVTFVHREPDLRVPVPAVPG